jgi:hypothetical protein
MGGVSAQQAGRLEILKNRDEVNCQRNSVLEKIERNLRNQ